MNSFYYVLSFNLSNPIIKSIIDKNSILTSVDSIVDFKIRSKFFISIDETTDHIAIDFEKKEDLLFEEKDQTFKIASIVNPNTASEEDLEEMFNMFGQDAIKYWDESCKGVMFFMLDEPINHNSWLCKYEVFVADEVLEHSKNGDFILTSLQEASSTYH